MERKTPFIDGERYHLFTRGVEKRNIFSKTEDYERFMILLFLANSEGNVHIGNLTKKYKGESFIRMFDEKRGKQLVDIFAYALMPNHIHIIVGEHTPGGISKFMLKLMTAYSMYFNARYDRSGPLFTRPFRSRHVDSDEYFRWVFAYVTLNPLALFQADWQENGIRNIPQASDFMLQHHYSSYYDYFVGARTESTILNKHKLPHRFDQDLRFDEVLIALASVEPGL